jgi:hypothetical protein
MEVVRVKHFFVTYHPGIPKMELCDGPEKDNGVHTVFSGKKDCIFRGVERIDYFARSQELAGWNISRFAMGNHSYPPHHDS